MAWLHPVRDWSLYSITGAVQLAEVGPEWLRVDRLPAYAPDLNPDEGIWSYLKRVEFRNICCRSLRDLREALREAAVRLCQKPEIIKGCVREARYHV